MECGNVALTLDNRATWQAELGRLDQRLTALPPLPPLLRHQTEQRHDRITTSLAGNPPAQPGSSPAGASLAAE